MKVDLQQKLVFPDVVQTNLRPDIVIWSTAPKKMILLELTAPWAERTDESNEIAVKVPRTGRYVQGERVHHLDLPCRSRM